MIPIRSQSVCEVTSDKMKVFLSFLCVICAVAVNGKGIGKVGAPEVFLEDFFDDDYDVAINLHHFDNLQFTDQLEKEEDAFDPHDNADTYDSNFSSAFIEPFTNRRFIQERRRLIREDESNVIGNNIEFSTMEESVNNIFKFHKQQEIRDALNDMRKFGGALHFNRGKQYIARSKVYSIIERMPKGCNLNAHLLGSIGAKNLVEIIKSDPDLLMCIVKDGNLKSLRFARVIPEDGPCEKYFNIADARAASRDVDNFDHRLMSFFVLYSAKPEYNSWGIQTPLLAMAGNIFQAIESLCFIERNFKRCVKYAIHELVKQNVNCMEFRHHLSPLSKDDGLTVPVEQTAALIVEAIQEYQRDIRDIPVKIIITQPLGLSQEDVADRMTFVNNMCQRYPEYFVGTDFFGESDFGTPWKTHYKAIQTLNPRYAKLYCTVGKTNWIGSNADYNCFDVMIHPCVRIGTGFSCDKHTTLWDLSTDTKRVLECTFVSDQSVNLIQDLRNHPCVYHIMNGNLVVLGTGMHGITKSTFSHEFYFVAMIFTHIRQDYRPLEQLVENSITYSSLTLTEKHKVFAEVQEQQRVAGLEIIKGYYK